VSSLKERQAMAAKDSVGSGRNASNIRAQLGALLVEYYGSSQRDSIPERLAELAEALARRIEEQKRSSPPTETSFT